MKPKISKSVLEKAFERESKARTLASKRASKGELKMKKAQAKNLLSKTSRQRNRLVAVGALGTEATAAYAKGEEERTKRAAISLEKLKSWNDLMDGNPSPSEGQEGSTQKDSTTDIGSTDRRTRDSVNYG